MKERPESESDLERRLRQALWPTDPPPGFAERVMAAAEKMYAPSGNKAPTPFRDRSGDRSGRRSVRRRWTTQGPWLAAAATVVLAVAAGAGWTWHQHSEALRARAAHEQVVRALRISSEALNAALAAAVNPIPPGDS